MDLRTLKTPIHRLSIELAIDTVVSSRLARQVPVTTYKKSTKTKRVKVSLTKKDKAMKAAAKLSKAELLKLFKEIQ